MSKFLLSSIILLALTACNGQDIPQAQKRSEAVIITDSSGLALEQRIKVYASEKNDSNFVGMSAPRLKAVDINGDTINQKELSKIVFYNFWFTGCAPCISEMPSFNKLEEEYGDRVDFVAITYERLEDLPAFFEEHPFNFSHYTMDRNEINKLDLARGYPTTFVVVDGKIVSWKAGGLSANHPSFKEEMNKQNEYYRKLFDDYLN